MRATEIESAEDGLERPRLGYFASVFRMLKQYLIMMDHVVAWTGVVLMVSVFLIYAVAIGINALDAIIGLPQGFVQGVGNAIGKAGPIVMLSAIIVYPRLLLALIGHFWRKRSRRAVLNSRASTHGSRILVDR